MIALDINYSYLPKQIGHLCGLAHLRATQHFTEALHEIGLTPKQAVALEFVANNPTISQRHIAEHIGTTPTVLVGILDHLSDRGLVRRVRSTEDRRRHTVQVTHAGQTLRAEIREASDRVEAQLRAESDLNMEEWKQLTKLMQKLTHREVQS